MAGEALRVLQVVGSFEGGGAQRQAFNLVIGLCALGVEAKGVALGRLGDYVRWSNLPSGFVELGADRKRPLTVLRAALRLRRLLHRWRPDAIHVQGNDTLPFVSYAVWGLRARPHVFFTWHDSGRVLHHQGRPRGRMLNALAGCAGVFGSSSDVASRLAEAARIPHVGIFHGGVPESPPATPAAPPLILWVGRFVPDKRPELLVRAIDALRETGMPFRVAMMGPTHPGSDYLEDLREQVRSRGLDDLIALPGSVADTELERWLAQASIAVQTSATEGLSMALLEQMMRGLAIVATDVGDTSVALNGGRCGVLLPRDADHLMLAARLANLLRDAEHRVSLGRRARERALSTYSIGSMAARARDIYALAKRGKKSDAP